MKNKEDEKEAEQKEMGDKYVYKQREFIKFGIKSRPQI